MNRYKYLIKNIGLLTLGQFATKIITFLFTPLYTSLLLTEEYGIYDIYNTTVSLLIPILTVNIFEATLRYSIDGSKKSTSFRIGAKYTLIGCALLCAIVGINVSLKIYPILNRYWYYLVALFVFTAITNLLSSYARGIDRVGTLALSGVIASLTTIGANVLFLVVFKIGIDGYFLSHILGIVMQAIYLSITINPIKTLRISFTDIEYEKEMRKYSIPLIWNSLAWWINDISDRYIVTAMCGLAANGIYAAAYKIPSMLNIFQTIFNRAWTLSAVKDYDKDDKSGFFTKTYEAYNMLIVVLCSILLLGNKLIARFLFRKEFYTAWEYAPFLLMAIIFGSLSGYIGGVFSAVKDTKIYSYSTGIGAITNIVLNILLINIYGVIGAAIATYVSNVVIWLIRLYNVRKYLTLKINLKKHIKAYLLLLGQTIALLCIKTNNVLYSTLGAITGLIILMFSKEIRSSFQGGFNVIKK